MRPGSWLAAGLAVGAVAWLTMREFAERVRISGASMEPLLRDGDRVLVSRLTYRLRAPRPGEVVLARVAAVPGGLTVKRVAALDGAGRVVLRGDNLAFSIDSRRFGPVRRRAVLGRVWYRYWPPNRRGRL